MARLVPPDSVGIAELSEELGIPPATLKRWRVQAATGVDRESAERAGAPQVRMAPRHGTDRQNPAGQPTNTLQTLDRGLQALTMIAQTEQGISIAELAAGLDVHRAIAYRIAATLESRGLIARADRGRLRLGGGLLTLASRFEPQLRALAHPLLIELAEATRAAAFLSVPAGQDCVAIMVIEPEGTLLRVAYRVGSRHPLGRGAAGIAILSGRPASANEPDSVRAARRDGFSVTHGELQRGAVGVASPVHDFDGVPARLEASLGVVAFEDLDVATATDLVMNSAGKLATALWRKDGNTYRPRARP